jgi:hypothetical protein
MGVLAPFRDLDQVIICHLRFDVLKLRLFTRLASAEAPAFATHLEAKLHTYLPELGHRAFDLNPLYLFHG